MLTPSADTGYVNFNGATVDSALVTALSIASGPCERVSGITGSPVVAFLPQDSSCALAPTFFDSPKGGYWMWYPAGPLGAEAPIGAVPAANVAYWLVTGAEPPYDLVIAGTPGCVWIPRWWRVTGVVAGENFTTTLFYYAPGDLTGNTIWPLAPYVGSLSSGPVQLTTPQGYLVSITFGGSSAPSQNAYDTTTESWVWMPDARNVADPPIPYVSQCQNNGGASGCSTYAACFVAGGLNITVTGNGGSPVTTKTTKAGYQPFLRGALGMALGGGSPRLVLCCSRTYIEWTETTTVGGGVSQYSADATFTSSAVRCCYSPDFGQTFLPGVDILAEGSGGQIVDGQVLTTSYPLTSPIPSLPPGPPQPSGWAEPQPTCCLVLPHGRIYVNGYGGPQADPSPSGSAWLAARLTDNVQGQAGWRQARTANMSLGASEYVNAYVPFPYETQGKAIFLAAGGFHGTKGGGGKSGGPASLRNWGWRSDDGGDTWTQENYGTPPSGYFLSQSPGATSENIVYQKGQAWDGVNWSGAGFCPVVFSALNGSGPLGTPPQGGVAAGPGNILAVCSSGEGEIARAILGAPQGGPLSLTAARFGFGTAASISPQPAGTEIVYGTLWDTPQPVVVSVAGDGTDLEPITNVPGGSGLATSAVCAWAWMNRIVLAVAVGNTITIYVSDNDGLWFVQTVQSTDNGVSWY